MNVGVCLVKFQQSELGIMALIHTFVSENSADFVNFFKPADDKAFKIKFQSNTKVHIDIERVVVRNERPCVCAARDVVQNGGFDFQISFFVQKVSDFAKNHTTFHENRLDFRINDKVNVTLTITKVGVGKSVEFFGERQKRL